eukprot:SM001618S02180  [mRNA]  locus=s1618:110:292:+ [translate_table: standard]
MRELADVAASAIGCSVCSAALLAWALAYSVGGEALIGPAWSKLAVYNIADEFQSWLAGSS